ncbi:cell wall-binding repeat-containing protein [Peptostreptococcus faecalis]|uniref:cell wall-binding repeat-containing protein n=1 Tax=Peptostreptococcus faecalis TaxID=2045015 RepID=UPI000C79F8FB|nr:cell wall-binding repeat-containing protein [Peptostreptococcus faecalis]
MKKIISLCLGSMVLASSISISSADSLNVSRIAGESRYDTSLYVSKNNFESSDYLFVASGEVYSDALIGGSLTSQTKSPVILVKKNNLEQLVTEEAKRLSPKEIYVLGGKNTISDDVLNRIKNDTKIKTQRIAGHDRIGTANEVNELRKKLYKDKLSSNSEITPIYVNGYNFYDSLYSAPYVGINEPINNNLLSIYLSRPTIEAGEHKIVWGDINIKDGFYPNEFTTKIDGKNRYETSTIIAGYYKENLNIDVDTIIITSGEDYPDGLSASSLTGIYKAPIILTPKKYLDESVVEYIKSNTNIKNVIIVGGENSISKGVEEELKNLK